MPPDRNSGPDGARDGAAIPVLPPAVTPNQNRGFAVYLHWPFCLQKCPYCDFNSHVRAAIDENRWRDAYLLRIAAWRRHLPRRAIDSIFFGGGTPSLMTAGTVGAILAALEDAFGFAGDIEITLEANPTSSEAGRFRDLVSAGVNRFSLGLQALNDRDLKALGRGHSVAEARAALQAALATGVRVSGDIIYAREGQDLAAWRRELADVLALGCDHLSLYQLTMERGTAFFSAWQRGELVLPDEDTAVDMFEITQELCSAAGLPAYEISNHARPGNESRHNLIYWRYGEYLGIGPGAHGRLLRDGQRIATDETRLPEHWLKKTESAAEHLDVGGVVRENVLTRRERVEEMVMMGLRLTEGISVAALEAEALMPLRGGIAKAESLDALLAEGLLGIENGYLRASPRGLLLLNQVTAAILT